MKTMLQVLRAKDTRPEIIKAQEVIGEKTITFYLWLKDGQEPFEMTYNTTHQQWAEDKINCLIAKKRWKWNKDTHFEKINSQKWEADDEIGAGHPYITSHDWKGE